VRHAAWGLALVGPIVLVLLVLLVGWRPHTPPSAVTLAAARGVRGTSSTDLMRTAVLPFANLGAPDDNYFAAGMPEEITSRLAGLSRIAMSSSTTVTRYDRTGKSLQKLGVDLGVDYVVEGTAPHVPQSIWRPVCPRRVSLWRICWPRNAIATAPGASSISPLSDCRTRPIGGGFSR
jgi:hypothetical protein